MSNLVNQWKKLDQRQNEINGSGEKSQNKLDAVNLVISMAKIDLESRMTKTEKETL